MSAAGGGAIEAQIGDPVRVPARNVTIFQCANETLQYFNAQMSRDVLADAYSERGGNLRRASNVNYVALPADEYN